MLRQISAKIPIISPSVGSVETEWKYNKKHINNNNNHQQIEWNFKQVFITKFEINPSHTDAQTKWPIDYNYQPI